jgi:hypothetical protein
MVGKVSGPFFTTELWSKCDQKIAVKNLNSIIDQYIYAIKCHHESIQTLFWKICPKITTETLIEIYKFSIMPGKFFDTFTIKFHPLIMYSKNSFIDQCHNAFKWH